MPETKNQKNSIFYVIVIFAGFFVVSGCGGGGGGTTGGDTKVQAAASCGAGCVMRPAAAGVVGPSGSTLSGGNVTLTASLAATQTITLYEKFYLSNRPGDIVGAPVEIQPDGMQFSGAGATLCLSYAGTGLSGGGLAIYTGASLDQPLTTWNKAASQQVCTTLKHASPYGIRLARTLSIPEYTIFGSLDTKDKYYYSVQTTTDADVHGSYTQYRVHVECNLKCLEDGDRYFRFYTGENSGDIYIRDTGSYQLWRDAGSLSWTELYSADGAVYAGIAYLLALEYVKYFAGSSAFDATIALLDPSQNAIQRFISYDSDSLGYDRYTSITRNGDAIALNVRNDGNAERIFTVDRTTARITKAVAGQGSTTALPSETGYITLQQDLLAYVNEVIGLDDTPDQTAGDSWDQYKRYTPSQELFAINVRNLITGHGWSNLEAIEAYYRDRQETMITGPGY